MSVHDRWHGAETGEGKRWECRWRDGGVQHKRRFQFRQQADRFDAKQKLDPETRNAREGRALTVDQMMATWLATKADKRPKTVEACQLDASEVTHQFGKRLAKDVRPSEIRQWTARTRGASIRRRSLAAMRQAYRLAVADGLLVADPTDKIPLPKTEESDRSALTWPQMEELAAATGSSAPLVWVLGMCGPRLGEAIALDVADVGEKRLRVRKSKTGKARDVPIPEFVRDMLDLSSPGPLFRGAEGGRLNANNWRRRVFEPAAASVGLGTLTVTKDEGGREHRTYKGLTPHSLRHTAASLSIKAGADVMVVQRMLGHASPAITLQVYSHLFDSSLDSVAARMHQQRGES